MVNSLFSEKFWSQQFSQITEEGIVSIWRKLKTIIRMFIIFVCSILVIPLVIIIRTIRPWYWIRFGWFLGSRIGHFSFDVENYLTEKKLGLHPKKGLDIFFYRWGKPANEFFSKIVKRHLFINNLANSFYTANNWIPGGSKHTILPAMVRSGSRDLDCLFRKVGPQLKFTREEIDIGLSFLRSIGMNENGKFVCLVARDSAYLSKDALHSRGNWDYHSYRDSDIDSYIETTLALAGKGYWVFRMGKKVQQPCQVAHPHVVDYANSEYRSDFLDIWLMANCFFCISNGTGLDEIARIFRRPAVYVNNLPLGDFVTYDHVITNPKHLIYRENNNKLTLDEHLLHSYYRTEEYVDAGIKIEDLSQDEINQAVLEMEARLNHKWEDSEEDRQLQVRFWEIFRSHKGFNKNHREIHPEARVGSHFLRTNPEWLN